MDVFFRSIPALLIFPTLAALAWIRGGTNGDMLVPTVPWLLALVFEVLICFPQRHYGEDAVQARQRCWRRVGRDPVFFLTLLFLVVVLGVAFLNKGLCPTCDYDTILANLTGAEFELMPDILAEKAPNPPIPFAPFCVNLAQHFEVLMWFLPALTAMLAARHALLRNGKRLLVELLVWNAAALAVFGFVQRATGAKFVMIWDQAEYNALLDAINKPLTDVNTGKPLLGYRIAPNPDFFAMFGYPNMAGCFFMLAFALSISVWMTRVRDVDAEPHSSSKAEVTRQRLLLRFIRAHYALVPLVLNFLAVLFTYCRAAIIMSLGIAVLAFVYHVLRMLLSRVDRARQIKRAAFNFVGAVLLLVIGVVFAPNDVLAELRTVDTDGFLVRVTGKNDFQSRIAVELFKKYPAFGCGGWGYKHLSLNLLSPEEKKKISLGTANVHNDYLQFLCEHGAVGFVCLVGIFFCLIVPIFREWGRLYRAARFLSPDNAPSSPRAIYCFPPGTFWILVGCFAVTMHAVVDAPLRSGAVLGLFFVSLACADGYLPHQSEPRP